MAENEINASGISASMESDDFQRTYIRLRTVLDGLEINALRYALKDLNPDERTRRAEEITALLMPIVAELQKKMRTEAEDIPSSGCAPGLYDCDGCCVPYQCP